MEHSAEFKEPSVVSFGVNSKILLKKLNQGQQLRSFDEFVLRSTREITGVCFSEEHLWFPVVVNVCETVVH